MKLKDVKNIRLGGQNVLSIKYYGQYIWRKQTESTPLAITFSFQITNTTRIIFGESFDGNQIDYVEIDGTKYQYAQDSDGYKSQGLANGTYLFKVVFKNQDSYDLSYLFDMQYYGSRPIGDVTEILPNANKYQLSGAYRMFRLNSSNQTRYINEIKGLNNLIPPTTPVNYNYTFDYAGAKKIDISDWDIVATSFSNGFRNHSTYPKLEEVYIGSITYTGSSTLLNTVFSGCSLLREIRIKSLNVGIDLSVSDLLSKESIYSVAEATVEPKYGSGKYTPEITISKTVRDKFTDEEWADVESRLYDEWYFKIVDTSVAAANLISDED